MAKYLDFTGLSYFKEKLEDLFRKKEDKINASDVIYNETPLDVAIKTDEFKGEKGDTGSPGQNGKDGADGAPGTAAGFGTPTANIDANVGTPSVEISASGPDTAKVFQFTFKNLKGAKGETGETGAKGETGTRGSRWNHGTAITGTNSTGTVFSGSGITDALINDYYLNTQTGNTYRCTVAGNASTAKWAYSGCIKGPEGDAATVSSITIDEIDELFTA